MSHACALHSAAPMKHRVLRVFTSNRALVLGRIVQLAHRRTKVVSLTASSRDGGPPQIHLVVDVPDDAMLELLVRRLNRLVDVDKVVELDLRSAHLRSATLVKVAASERTRGRVVELAVAFSAVVIDLSPTTVTIFHADTPARREELLALLAPHGLLDVVDAGTVGIPRGPNAPAAGPELRSVGA